MKIFTIGFTKKSAEQFFNELKQAGVRRLIDVRLNNVSQLAGFTKRDDLRFFTETICGAKYTHELLLAPEQEMLDTYKKQRGSWLEYEQRFLKLMAERGVENRLHKRDFEGACLLCSESTPHHCHRRLAAEYMKSKWGDIEIVHLP